MGKQESPLKSKLLQTIKVELPGFVAIRHEDVRTSGIPDLSMTGFGRTTWWEIKHGTPGFETKGIQELTCLRLAAAGYCRYIIFEEKKDVKRTMIIHPRHIGAMLPEDSCVGFDYKWVVAFMKKVHQCVA